MLVASVRRVRERLSGELGQIDLSAVFGGIEPQI